MIFNLSQDPGVPANAGWVRWAGGFVVGVAVLGWLAASNPENQKTLVVGLGTAFTLAALALLYSTVAGEYHGLQWFIWLSILVNAALAGAMWWLSAKYT
jgi:heme A synthase